MKLKLTNLFFLLLSIILLPSCQREFQVEYAVANESDTSIYIIFPQPNSTQIDTNLISRGQELTFFIYMGESQTTHQYMDERNTLPFDNLEVFDINMNTGKCDVSNFVCWREYMPRKKEGVGKYSLHFRID